MMTHCLQDWNSVVISSHVMNSKLVLILCLYPPVTRSILNASFSLKVGHSDSIRPCFHDGVDVFSDPGSSGVVASQACLDAPRGGCFAGHVVTSFIFQNGRLKPNRNHYQSFNYPLCDLLVCLISPFHLGVGHFPKLETGMNPAHKQAG